MTLSTHAGMQFAGGLTEQIATAGSLKRRERSPSPRPSKVRQAPCRSDSTLPFSSLTSYTRSSGRIPVHSAESRLATLRKSTPTRRQVSRGDGHSMPTAAETTRPARRRARGLVRVWTGSGGHRNSILQHRHSAGNIRSRAPGRTARRRRWMRTAMLAWTARLYVSSLSSFSNPQSSSSLCPARAGRRSSA